MLARTCSVQLTCATRVPGSLLVHSTTEQPTMHPTRRSSRKDLCLAVLVAAVSCRAFLWLWPNAVQLATALLLLLLLLVSPNLLCLLHHGTPDLLLAAGYTLDTWTAERRGENGLNLSNIRTKPTEQPFECVICLRQRPTGTEAVQLPCNHQFCSGAECQGVLQWLQQHGSCPLCRASLINVNGQL